MKYSLFMAVQVFLAFLLTSAVNADDQLAENIVARLIGEGYDSVELSNCTLRVEIRSGQQCPSSRALKSLFVTRLGDFDYSSVPDTHVSGQGEAKYFYKSIPGNSRMVQKFAGVDRISRMLRHTLNEPNWPYVFDERTREAAKVYEENFPDTELHSYVERTSCYGVVRIPVDFWVLSHSSSSELSILYQEISSYSSIHQCN